MKNYIIKKNDCLDIINKNKLDKKIHYIHPLLQYVMNDTFKIENCYKLPQYNDNNILIYNANINNIEQSITLNNSISESSNINQTTNSSIINPLLYFTMPINSNNFLEIIFGISTIFNLNEWINLINPSDIELLDFVLNLYWKNYYNKIDEDINNFIIINKKIIKKFLNKDIDNEIIKKIVNKLIKNNYGKKIKYINKIKKYLTKYI